MTENHWQLNALRTRLGTILRADFSRNLGTVMFGILMAQVIGYLCLPILSRLYSKEDFGALGSFQAAVTLLTPLLTFQLGQALMLPKRRTEAINLWAGGILGSVFWTLLLAVGCLFFMPILKGICHGLPAMVLWLLPAYALSNGVNQMMISWRLRHKQFKTNTASQMLRSIGVNGVQLGAGSLLSPSPFYLALGSVVGEFCSNLNFIGYFIKNDLRLIRRALSFHWIKRLIRKYYDFPVYSTAQNLLNASSVGIPVLLLGYFFGLEIVGAYAMAFRLIVAPVGLLAEPLRQVLFQRVCEDVHRALPIYPLYRKVTLLLVLGVCSASVLGFFVMPWCFSFLLGAQWILAGKLAAWLLLWQGLLLCNIPSTLAIRILLLQRYLLLYDALTLILRCLTIILGGVYLSAYATVALFSVLGVILNLLLISVVWFILRNGRQGQPGSTMEISI